MQGGAGTVKKCKFKKSGSSNFDPSSSKKISSKSLTVFRHSKDNQRKESSCLSVATAASEHSAPEDENFAVKIVRTPDEEMQELAKQEFDLVRGLDHPNIVKMHDMYFNSLLKTTFIVMDHIPGVTLKQFFEDEKLHLSEEDAKSCFWQLMSALEYLHKQGICHRDVNPNNIMISSDSGSFKITLIDFNVSTRFFDKASKTRLMMLTDTGTPKYQAPEIFNG